MFMNTAVTTQIFCVASRKNWVNHTDNLDIYIPYIYNIGCNGLDWVGRDEWSQGNRLVTNGLWSGALCNLPRGNGQAVLPVGKSASRKDPRPRIFSGEGFLFRKGAREKGMKAPVTV